MAINRGNARKHGFDFSFASLSAENRRLLHQHAGEITVLSQPPTGAQQRNIAHTKAHKLRAILYFVENTVQKYFFALLTIPQTIVADPVGAAWALFVMPILNGGLVILQLLFAIGGFIGAGKYGSQFSHEYGHDLSVVNMLAPQIFDDEAGIEIADAAFKALSNPYGYPGDLPTTAGNDNSPTVPHYFNLDISKLCIILCALVYERDDGYVHKASKEAQRQDEDESTRRNHVADYLLESVRFITWQASKYGLNFSSVTDFTTIGGPFCGIFWPKDFARNFIIIAFKGTSPNNFSEFLVDATIAYRNAQGFFGDGQCHEGFYSSLVPGTESKVDPYGHIINNLRHVAKAIRQKTGGDKVNLWITGHSLGSAVAALLHARLLFAPRDLGEDLVLAQGYMYGTPRVGDADFASAFDFATSHPFDNTTQSLWRIIDKGDFVTTVPPGLADDQNNRTVLPRTSLLNYAHFGTGFHLTGESGLRHKGYELQKGTFRGGSVIIVVEIKKTTPTKEDSVVAPPPKTVKILGVEFDPIRVLNTMAAYGGPIEDHMPSQYYARLKLVKASVVV